MGAPDVADIADPAVGLQTEQIFEIDCLPLGLLSARLLVASIKAFCDEGMPHSRHCELPSASVAHGRRIVRIDFGHRR
jgi:hypothetical protein